LARSSCPSDARGARSRDIPLQRADAVGVGVPGLLLIGGELEVGLELAERRLERVDLRRAAAFRAALVAAAAALPAHLRESDGRRGRQEGEHGSLLHGASPTFCE
jgi:hypothetical protein